LLSAAGLTGAGVPTGMTGAALCSLASEA
jgi:hypothetical protein